MAITFALPVGLENVDGSINVDETVASINLRTGDYSTAAYNGTLIDHGVYQFTSVEPGEYRVYSSTTHLSIFGIIKIGEHNAVLMTGTQTVAGVKTFSNQIVLSAGVQTDTISEKTSTAGVTIDGVLIKDSLDTSGIVAKTGNQTIAGTKTFTNDIKTDYIYEDTANAGVTFPDDPTTIGTLVLTQAGSNFAMAGYKITGLSDATTSSGAATLGQVEDLIDAVEVSPGQVSSNTRYLIPAGVQETNKVYTSWAACQDNARQYAGNNWRITIEIKGAGEGSNDITVTNGAISGNEDFNSYVNVKGDNQNIRLIVGDTAYEVLAGKSIIENVTIYESAPGSAEPSFEKFIFKDVYFDFNTLSLSFIDCEFRGNCYVKNVGTISFDADCIGGYVATNGAITARMFGIDGLTSTDF